MPSTIFGLTWASHTELGNFIVGLIGFNACRWMAHYCDARARREQPGYLGAARLARQGSWMVLAVPILLTLAARWH